jgi:hypothetical protein
LGSAADRDVAIEGDERVAHGAIDDNGTVGDEDVVDGFTGSDFGPTGDHDDVVGLFVALRTDCGRVRRGDQQDDERGEQRPGEGAHRATSLPP